MFKRIVAIMTAAGKEYMLDQGLRLAAALSYYSIFSIVPLLFLVVAAAGFLLGDPAAVEDLVKRVTDVAGPDVGDSFESLLGTVRSQRGGTLSVGIVLTAFAASSVFQQVQGVLSSIFHVPRSKRRTGAIGWLVQRAIGVAAAVALAVLVFTPLVAVAGVEWLVDLLPDALGWLNPIVRLGIPLLSLLMLMLVIGLTLQALTPVGIPWKAATRGGATTAVMGLSAAALVGIYLDRAGSTGTLGALGGVAILLFFFYLLWTVFVFGAEVTKVYGDYLEYGDIVQPSERFQGDEPRRDVPAGMAPAQSAFTSLNSPSAVPSRHDGLFAFIVGVAIGWFARRRD